jgi:hypothetical protein
MLEALGAIRFYDVGACRDSRAFPSVGETLVDLRQRICTHPGKSLSLIGPTMRSP